MKLIERTSPSSLQSFVVNNQEDHSRSPVELIKSNLMQRLLRQVEAYRMGEGEFREKIAPSLCIRIIKVSKPDTPDKEVHIGNLNFPTFKETDEVSPDIVSSLKQVGGVEMPRDRFLSERLKELNFSCEDPFRVKTSKVELVHESILEDLTFSDLEEGSEEFYDFLYSSIPSSLLDTVKATYILSLDKILKSGSAREQDFTVEALERMVSDIDDPNERKEVFQHVQKYMKEPLNRPRMVDESNRVLKMKTESPKSDSKPIKTWKIVAACVIVILGVLAYVKRDAIKQSYEIAKNSQDFEGKSKFGAFVSHLFNSGKRNSAVSVLNAKADSREAQFKLDNREDYINILKSRVSKYNILKNKHKQNYGR
jgi:hypothetical protein